MKAAEIEDQKTLIKYLQATIDRKDEQIKSLYEQIGKLMTMLSNKVSS
jgi:SMC interacting uncharacterized protein involved in chromosome segregation